MKLERFTLLTRKGLCDNIITSRPNSVISYRANQPGNDNS